MNLILDGIIFFLIGMLSLGHCLMCCGVFYLNPSANSSSGFWSRQITRWGGYFILLCVLTFVTNLPSIRESIPWIQTFSQFLLGLFLIRDFFQMSQIKLAKSRTCHAGKISSEFASHGKTHTTVLLNYFLKTVSCGWIVFLLLSLSELPFLHKLPLITAFWLGSLPGFVSFAHLKQRISILLQRRISLLVGSLLVLTSFSFLIGNPERMISHQLLEKSQSWSRELIQYVGDGKAPIGGSTCP